MFRYLLFLNSTSEASLQKKTHLIFLSLLLFCLPASSYGQYNFGDIQVDSFQQLFIPSSDLWGEETRGYFYPFIANSDVWANHKSAGLLLKSDLQRVNFISKSKKEPQPLIKKLSPKLSQQFGTPKEVTVDDPIVITPSNITMKRWRHKENGTSYQISLGQSGVHAILIITKK